MISRRRFLAGMGSAALCQSLSGCSWTGDQPVTVAAHVWPGYEPLFLAQREGWLDANRVRLVETSSASDSLRALSGGKVEGAALTLDEVLRARGSGMPLSVVLIFDISAGADMVVTRPGITRIADLKGRSVCYEPGAVGELMLTELLRVAGLTKHEIRLIPIPVDRQPDAWNHSQGDAFVTYEPVASHLLARGGVRLFDSRQIPDTIVDVLAFRHDLLDYRHAGAIRHLTECHFQALKHLRRNPEDAAYRMASHMKLKAAEVLSSYKGLLLPDAANNFRLLSGDPPELLVTARKLSAIMVRSGLLRQEDTMTSLIRADFLPLYVQGT